MDFQWWIILRRYLPLTTLKLSSFVLDLSSPVKYAAFERDFYRKLTTRQPQEYSRLLGEMKDLVLSQNGPGRDAVRPSALITWQEVEQLSRDALVAFESHGVSHTAVGALEAEELDRELRQSQRAIYDHTNILPRHFCYPYGLTESIGSRAPELAARYYQSAVTMDRGRIKGRNPFLLPRIPIYKRDSPLSVRLKVLTA